MDAWLTVTEGEVIPGDEILGGSKVFGKDKIQNVYLENHG
jgi:hypothetical protein